MGDSKTVWVGNLTSSADEKAVRSIFEVCGEVTNVRLAGRKGLATIFSFVEFANAGHAQTALAMDGLRVGDRDIKVSIAKTKFDPNLTRSSGVRRDSRDSHSMADSVGSSARPYPAHTYPCSHDAHQSSTRYSEPAHRDNSPAWQQNGAAPQSHEPVPQYGGSQPQPSEPYGSSHGLRPVPLQQRPQMFRAPEAYVPAAAPAPQHAAVQSTAAYTAVPPQQLPVQHNAQPHHADQQHFSPQQPQAPQLPPPIRLPPPQQQPLPPTLPQPYPPQHVAAAGFAPHSSAMPHQRDRREAERRQQPAYRDSREQRQPSRPTSGRGSQQQGADPRIALTVHIDGIEEGFDEESIEMFFSNIGKLVAARVIPGTVMKLGKGWAEFKTLEEADMALKYNGQILGSTLITVRSSKSAIARNGLIRRGAPERRPNSASHDLSQQSIAPQRPAERPSQLSAKQREETPPRQRRRADSDDSHVHEHEREDRTKDFLDPQPSEDAGRSPPATGPSRFESRSASVDPDRPPPGAWTPAGDETSQHNEETLDFGGWSLKRAQDGSEDGPDLEKRFKRA